MTTREVDRVDLFAFAPERRRTAALDRAIRGALADSVRRVLDAGRRAGLSLIGDAAAWCDGLRAASTAPPGLWACYHDLVQAALREDAGAVETLASELIGRRPDAPARPGRILTLTEADLGERDVARYRAVIDADATRPLGLLAAAANEVVRLAELVAEGRALLENADPVLLDEIDVLGHQIVLATNAGGGFGGAATVFLWGAVILNPDRVPDRVTLVEGLAHETAHALLFGMTLGANLTTNDPSERYASPLRSDARPIEGIVHAVYVLARMNHALEALRSAADLSAAEQGLIEGKLQRNRTSYEAGLQTVLAHARFSPEGEAIFAACREAMSLT